MQEVHKVLVSRAIFEFPRLSNSYFSFYNTHLEPCQIPSAIDYISNRQSTFYNDLANHYVPESDGTVSIYPPVFAGDMNTHDGWELECGIDADEEVFRYFQDAPYSNFIDKVWVGKAYDEQTGDMIFESDRELDVVHTPWDLGEMTLQACNDYYFPFICKVLGYVAPNDNDYSDHSPTMVEIRAL